MKGNNFRALPFKVAESKSLIIRTTSRLTIAFHVQKKSVLVDWVAIGSFLYRMYNRYEAQNKFLYRDFGMVIYLYIDYVSLLVLLEVSGPAPVGVWPNFFLYIVQR